MNTYKKSDSISSLSTQDDKSQEVKLRIQRLYGNLDKGAESYGVLKAACEDLLGLNDSVQLERPLFSLRAHVVEEISRLQDAEIARYLFYRYRYDIYPLTHEVDQFPPCVQIEPASICNYRCVFCYQTDSALTKPANGHMGMMDLDLFKTIVDQIEGSVEAVTLASRGEPLIHKKIVQMLSYLEGKFLALKMNTNAWYLDEEKIHAILQAGVNTLVFSADAAEEPLYSQLRVNGDLDRVIRNIEKFQNIRLNEYPSSRIITRVSGVKYNEKQDFESMQSVWSDLVDQVAFVDYVPWENVYQKPANEVDQPCSDLFRRMFVWWDGRTNPCDVDYLSTLCAGNAKVSKVSDIWKGETYSQLRQKHLAEKRGMVEPCKRCNVV